MHAFVISQAPTRSEIRRPGRRSGLQQEVKVQMSERGVAVQKKPQQTSDKKLVAAAKHMNKPFSSES